MKMNETPLARYWNGLTRKEKKAFLVETLHEALAELVATRPKRGKASKRHREKLLRSGVALGTGTGGAR